MKREYIYVQHPEIETPIFRAIVEEQEWPDYPREEDGPDLTAADIYPDYEPSER